MVVLSALVVTCLSLFVSAGGEPAGPGHSIVVTAGDGPFLFGRAVSLTVSYRNHGKAPWVIPTPTESTSAGVRYRSPGTDGLPHGYDLGRIEMTHFTASDGWVAEAVTIPTPKPISVAPGQSYDFPVTLEPEWSGHLVPGRWSVWSEDRALKLESNRVEIALRFRPESVAACLRLTEEEYPEMYKQIWHGEWLQKIMPGLELEWWYEDTPAPEMQQMKAEVKAKLEEFKKFLDDKANAAAIEAAIERINREAGLPAD